MSRLLSQTIDPSVNQYSGVHFISGVWYSSDVCHTPMGFYIGDSVVLTNGSKTNATSKDFDSRFINDIMGTISDHIYILSDSITSPDEIEVSVSGVGNSLNDFLRNQTDEDYEEFTDESDIRAQYIDFDIKMPLNPNTNDIPKKLDEDAVMQSIKSIVLSTRLWSDDALDIYSLIFEDMDAPFHERQVSEIIKEYILDRESRLSMLEIEVIPNLTTQNQIEIQIKFKMKNDQRKIFNYPLFVKIR